MGVSKKGVRCHKSIAAYLFIPLKMVIFIFCYEKK